MMPEETSKKDVDSDSYNGFCTRTLTISNENNGKIDKTGLKLWYMYWLMEKGGLSSPYVLVSVAWNHLGRSVKTLKHSWQFKKKTAIIVSPVDGMLAHNGLTSGFCQVWPGCH